MKPQRLAVQVYRRVSAIHTLIPEHLRVAQDPEPVEPWTGVWNATEQPIHCLQYDPFFSQISGSEDCLFLNVYKPKLVSKDLPVLVFIHGGAFMYGTGVVYDPCFLMDRDMVVVTINYRLGVLGFLSTGDELAPGNAGLKDQVMALRWVKQNIKAFGGDPDSITLLGQSAGAASVHYHYLSPMSKGTFNRGIALSGSAFAPWAYAAKPVHKAQQLASILGCPTETNQKMLACFRNNTGEDIINATSMMFFKPTEDFETELFAHFTPTAEGPEVKEPFITQHPYQASQTGAMMEAPLLVGVTLDEGLYPATFYQKTPELLSEVESLWPVVASELFQYNDTVPRSLHAAVAAKIKKHYWDGKAISQETFPLFVQALGDRLFASAAGKLAQSHSRSGQPVYMMRYSFRGEKSFTNAITWNFNDYGVSHADDILHVFKLPLLGMKKPGDLKMTEALINMIYSFATTGTPSLKQGGTEWLPVVPGPDLNFLELSSPTQAQMQSSADFGQISFWESLGFNENENYNSH